MSEWMDKIMIQICEWIVCAWIYVKFSEWISAQMSEVFELLKMSEILSVSIITWILIE